MNNLKNYYEVYFESEKPYDIPILKPTNIDISKLEWIPFNFALTAKDTKTKGVHFYLDDYQFERVWNNPNKYTELLKKFGAVLTPDFSQFIDMPQAIRIYNHYRKHWIGKFWQTQGINVIPTLCWSDEDSFKHCFVGEPKNSIISISSVGTQKNKQDKELFNKGYKKAIEILNPSQILWYGKCPIKYDWNVIKIEPFYNKIKERRGENGR